MRLLAIGDIHGHYQALDSLAQQVKFNGDDVVVTLGDYVDRGPQSKEVIDFLIALSKRVQLIPLRGNHEIMMLQAKEDAEARSGWLACGGKATLESYGVEDLSEIPQPHWDFISATLPFHESERDFFVHANAHADIPLQDQPEYMLHWEHFDAQPRHLSGKRMVCGHTPQKNGQPLDIGHAVCIDTWIYGPQGWLTCLDVRRGNYWQGNHRGQVRKGVLDTW